MHLILFRNIYIFTILALQRFTISYLTGKRCLYSNIYYKYDVFFTAPVMVRLRLLSMMYIFFISFLSCTFFINYWFVTDLFISSILSFRCRIDKYRTTFLNLLGCVAFAVRLWAYYYMDREIEFPRFFTLLIAFITSIQHYLSSIIIVLTTALVTE